LQGAIIWKELFCILLLYGLPETQSEQIKNRIGSHDHCSQPNAI